MWIICEGIDRSGKSTVAEYYRQQGYEIVHMSAPHKKYSETGYAGPSYLEEIVEMYNLYAGKDVFWDRSPWGELIWPEVFNRMPLLNDEDFEYLTQLEYNQSTTRYLMVPEDTEAHWKRCTDNKEPINRIQFVQAARLYDKLELDRDFKTKQLSDFSDLAEENKKAAKQKQAEKRVSRNEKGSSRDGGNADSSGSDTGRDKRSLLQDSDVNSLSMEQRLERANAIRVLLEGKIIKKKGVAFNDLDKDIRRFLNKELEQIFNKSIESSFTDDQVIVLQNMAQRILDKME